MREDRDKANPPIVEPAGRELARLRRERFALQENAKHAEIYTNELANRIRLCEKELTDAIRKKKAAAIVGNAMVERNHEHTITRLEREKAEAEREFNRARKVSVAAAAAVKEWSHHKRIEELQEIVG
jgi:DNA helicase IV